MRARKAVTSVWPRGLSLGVLPVVDVVDVDVDVVVDGGAWARAPVVLATTTATMRAHSEGKAARDMGAP
jgi:hypothetical protein